MTNCLANDYVVKDSVLCSLSLARLLHKSIRIDFIFVGGSPILDRYTAETSRCSLLGVEVSASYLGLV